jgi:hypothetical protein
MICGTLFLLTVLSPLHMQAGEPSMKVFFDRQYIPHFRQLFATHPVFAGLRKQMDTTDRARERAFLRSEVRLNDHLYDISRVGNLAQQMALLYLYTGDRDAAALARECVETLMRFPKWDYFLEGGNESVGLQRAPNSALAVSLVIEVLGDLVPPATRDAWLATMAKRGTEPCFRAVYGMRYPDRVKGWTMDTTSTYLLHRPLDRGINLARWPIILNTINLKAIPASALALSALTYRKYLGETEDTRRWLEQATYSVGTFRDIYTRDGSYDEGVSYAHYTTLHLVQAVEALQQCGVADLTDMLNWNGYQTYLLEMSLATRDDPTAIVNFSDAGAGGHASVSFWIARHTRDGQAQWFGQNLAVTRDVWSVLYYDSTVNAEAPPGETHLWRSDLDWIVGRTGYAPEDLVVAMRSGGPFNHEHADRNSIILKCFGERLVVDPMRPPYSFKDPAWKMRLTAGHSAVLIDGQGHQYVDGHEGTNASQAQARIIRRGERKNFMFWTSDATPAYRLVLPDAASVTRTVVMIKTFPAVLVIDKVVKHATASRIQARFYAYNSDNKGSVSAHDAGFRVIRPGARLGGWSAAEAGVGYTTAEPDIPRDQARKYPYVDVSTTRPEKEICLVTVLLPTAGDGPGGKVEMKRDANVYTATIALGKASARIRVMDTGTVPEFEVVEVR